MWVRTSRAVALIVGFGMLIAACGPLRGTSDESLPVTATSPVVSATSSTVSTTTTAPTASSTTTEAVSAATPDGSGCTPGEGDLPDGSWYGVVADLTADGLEFDLACWFSGDAAELAADEDGGEAPNGYFVRNLNPTTRILEPAFETPVAWFPEAGDPTSEEVIAFEEWVTATEDRGLMLGLWIEIDGGEVVEIQEQWVP